MQTIEQLSQYLPESEIQKIYKLKSEIYKHSYQTTDLEWEINDIFIENNLSRADFGI